MLGLLQHDIEWLEAISQDDDTRELFLRMAALSQEGRLEPFLTELARDDELDEQTKGTVAEPSFTEEAAPSWGKPPGFPQTPSTVARASLAPHREAMGDRGFEPRTSALSERRSNQLS